MFVIFLGSSLSASSSCSSPSLTGSLFGFAQNSLGSRPELCEGNEWYHRRWGDLLYALVASDAQVKSTLDDARFSRTAASRCLPFSRALLATSSSGDRC